MYEATKWKSQSMYMNSNDLGTAAARIQAGYRGKKGRKRAKEKKPKIFSQEEEQAALSIQAGARGRKSRKKAHHASSTASASYTEEHEAAIVRIQAAQRARKAQLDFANQRRSRKICLVGFAGAGKADQAHQIAERYGVVHISLAGLVQNHMRNGSEIGLQVRELINAGGVPLDHQLARMVRERLEQEDCKEKGWLLNGYPENETQAAMLLADNIVPEHLILLENSKEVAIERAVHRRVDPDTEHSWHLVTNPPPEEILPRLITRDNDAGEALDARWRAWEESKKVTMEALQNVLVVVDGDREAKEITHEIFHVIDDGARQFMLLGAPGTGKATQAKLLAEAYGVIPISVTTLVAGEVREKSRLGRKIQEAMAGPTGKIPDKLLLEVAKRAILCHEAQCKGWVLEGYPCTATQAQDLVNEGIIPEYCFVLRSSPEVIRERAALSQIHDQVLSLADFSAAIGGDEDTYDQDLEGIAKINLESLVELDAEGGIDIIFTHLRSVIERTARRLAFTGSWEGRLQHGEEMCEHHGLVHIVVDDLIQREIMAGTRSGLRAQSFLEAGAAIPDKLLVQLVKQKMREPECLINGFVLDGFPNTRSQIRQLRQAGISPSTVFSFEPFQSTNEVNPLKSEVEACDGACFYHVNTSARQNQVDLQVIRAMRFTPWKVVLVGGGATGKAVQASRFAAIYGVEHVSVRGMISQACAQGTESGVAAMEFIQRGELVPDDVVIPMVLRKLKTRRAKLHGWILDGFPRTEAQAAALAENGFSPEHFINLHCEPGKLVEEAAKRGGPGDAEELMASRLGAYFDTIDALKKRYGSAHHSLSADAGVEALWTEFQSVLEATAHRPASKGSVTSPERGDVPGDELKSLVTPGDELKSLVTESIQKRTAIKQHQARMDELQQNRELVAAELGIQGDDASGLPGAQMTFEIDLGLPSWRGSEGVLPLKYDIMTEPQSMKGQSCTLRIIHLNDVYLLENFPHLKTLIETNKTENCITTLGGDFVAPSLLSSLDSAYGMIDAMNKTPIDYVCFGNHENDLPMDKLTKRIDESNFPWINTNMQDFKYEHENKETKMPPFKIIEVNGKDGQKRKVGLLGLLTEDKNLYRPGAFGGATIEPVVAVSLKYKKILEEEYGCDLVVPMTHQVIAKDIAMANEGLGFPLLLGAHDHSVYTGEYGPDRCQVVKGGCDAHNALIVDITWPEASSSAPVIKWELVETKRWEPNPELALTVKQHMSLVWDLEHTVLRDLEQDKYTEDLSSENIRKQQTTMGTLICTAVRKANPCCDCVILNAGGIRGSKTYTKEKGAFTFGDLKTEVPFDSEIALVDVPGQVIIDSIEYSHQWWEEKEYSGFLQVDNRMVVEIEDGRHVVKEVNGEAVDPAKKYCCAMFYTTLNGMDNIVPIKKFGEETPKEELPPEDTAVPAKVMLTKYWYKEIWQSLGDIHDIDADGDGVINKDEIRAALQKKFHMEITEETVEAIHDAMDHDGDGQLKTEEAAGGVLHKGKSFVEY